MWRSAQTTRSPTWRLANSEAWYSTIYIPYHDAAIVVPVHLTTHRDIADTVDSTEAVRASEAVTSYGSSEFHVW